MDGDLGSGACGFNSYCGIVNEMPNCECPPEYTQIDPNNILSGCKPKIPLACKEDELGSPEAVFEFKDLSGTDWPKADYERFEPVTEDDCRKLCLKDCYCAVAIYRLF